MGNSPRWISRDTVFFEQQSTLAVSATWYNNCLLLSFSKLIVPHVEPVPVVIDKSLHSTHYHFLFHRPQLDIDRDLDKEQDMDQELDIDHDIDKDIE